MKEVSPAVVSQPINIFLIVNLSTGKSVWKPRPDDKYLLLPILTLPLEYINQDIFKMISLTMSNSP